jgi:protein TonB
MQLYWTPESVLRRGGSATAVRSRLGRFLTLSTAGHALVAVAAAWLSFSLLPPRPDDGLVVRTVDFVDLGPGPEASRPAVTAPAGRPSARADRPAPPARPTARARAERQAPTVPPSAAPPSPVAASVPTPDPPAQPAGSPVERPSAETAAPTVTPEDARLAAATPRSVGESVAARGPSSLSGATQRGAATPEAEQRDGPVATVALPPGLAQGADGGRAAGAEGTSAGAAAGGGAGAGRGIDTGDPDFGEYFRLIERRVRAAWRFPDGLGGTTQTVKIAFSLGPEGSLREARVVSSSSSVLNEGALWAMRRAAPFPPLPDKFRTLAGQPLVMSFTVTIR